MVRDQNSETASHVTSPGDLAESYAQIGKMLLIAEAASFGVGIPWIPPLPRTEELQKLYEAPLEEFVRLSLVNIPTTTLNSYAEDIEALAASRDSEGYLGIGGLSFLERYSLSAVLFIACFSLFIVTATWVKAAASLVIGISFLVALVVAGISSFICSEESRRSTFHWLLKQELLRRRGSNQDDSITTLQALAPDGA